LGSNGWTTPAPDDYPAGKQGDVFAVEFRVARMSCLGLNDDPVFQYKEPFSFQVATDDQAEMDHLWSAIIDNGGQVSSYGWCRNEWGVSW